MDYNRYDICIFNPAPVKGHEVDKIRPCTIVSPNELNKHLGTVIIAPITSKLRHYPFRPFVRVGKTSGSIMLDQIRCIDKSRLASRIGQLPGPVIVRVRDILREMFAE